MKTHLIRPRRRPMADGFTLIEIVLVITIIAILGASAIYLIKGNVDVAKETRAETDINNIVAQVKVFEARNFVPPTTEQGLNALVEKPTAEPVPERWLQLMDEVPTDPWKRPYQYEAPGSRSGGAFDIYSLGSDGVVSEDDIGNWRPKKSGEA